jgi:hypothetical protein
MPRCYLVKKAKQFGMRDWSNLGHNVHCEGTPTYSPLDYQEPSQSLPRPSGTGLIVFNVIFISYSNFLRGIIVTACSKRWYRSDKSSHKLRRIHQTADLALPYFRIKTDYNLSVIITRTPQAKQ